MNLVFSFANLGYLMDLLLHSLVVVPIVGTIAGLVVMVLEFRRHAEFQPARYAADNVRVPTIPICNVTSSTELTPTPAELAAVAIAEAAETSVLVIGRVRTAALGEL